MEFTEQPETQQPDTEAQEDAYLDELLDGMVVGPDGQPVTGDDAPPDDVALKLDTDEGEESQKAEAEPQTGEAFWKEQAERAMQVAQVAQAGFQRFQQMYGPMERSVGFLDQRTRALEETDRQQAELVRQDLAPEPGTPEWHQYQADQQKRMIDDAVERVTRENEAQRVKTLDARILSEVQQVSQTPEFQELNQAFMSWRSNEAKVRGVAPEQVNQHVLGEAAAWMRHYAEQGMNPVVALAQATMQYGGWTPSAQAAPAQEPAAQPPQDPELAADQARQTAAIRTAPPEGGNSPAGPQVHDIEKMSDVQVKKYMENLGGGDELRGWELYMQKAGAAIAAVEPTGF